MDQKFIARLRCHHRIPVRPSEPSIALEVQDVADKVQALRILLFSRQPHRDGCLQLQVAIQVDTTLGPEEQVPPQVNLVGPRPQIVESLPSASDASLLLEQGRPFLHSCQHGIFIVVLNLSSIEELTVELPQLLHLRLQLLGGGRNVDDLWRSGGPADPLPHLCRRWPSTATKGRGERASSFQAIGLSASGGSNGARKVHGSEP
mmetsp:Transcript_4383/g.14874  ORF Transcript_4383/g.14874 Transcript_4383/m.14874 type:complete len:204 (+) Transcript_4383:1538-2149(+)